MLRRVESDLLLRGVLSAEEKHVIVFDATDRRRRVSPPPVVCTWVATAAAWAPALVELVRVELETAQYHVTNLTVVFLALENYRWRGLQAEQARHQGVLHEDNHGDGIEDCGLALHVEPGVRFTEPDQAFQHADRLSIFAHFRVLPQKLIIGVQDCFGFLSDYGFENFLHEVNVLAQFGGAPRLLFVLPSFRLVGALL